MKTLAIDIETYSSVDIKKSGVYAYAESPDFDILLFAYAWDDEEVKIIDLTKEQLPDELVIALSDNAILKTAFNAQFERVCLSKHLKLNGFLDPSQWQCTAVLSAMLSLPASLDKVGEVLGVAEEKQKMTAGKALIRYFCAPCKANNYLEKNMPTDDLEKWELFKDYCIRDVEAERTIRNILTEYKFIEFETNLYALDQRINDLGVGIDSDLVDCAIHIDSINSDVQMQKAIDVSGLNNPKSVMQLKKWLEEENLTVDKLDKKTINDIISERNRNTISQKARQMLELKLELSKTSIKKYKAMQSALCRDNKVHGLLQFYGANRTGRWAGRLVQVQNLPRNYMKQLGATRKIVKNKDIEGLNILHDSVSDTLSQLIRTAFVPTVGKFAVVDFSAIEARVIAWLANEKWRNDVFATHGKIYEASASQMFHIAVDEVTKDLRQKGKIAELALGYGGSANALIAMGAIDMGLNESELPEIVSAWRQANPNIVKFWRDCERACIEAVRGKPVTLQYGLKFFTQKDALFIMLPSARCLSYFKPQLSQNRFGNKSISYYGVNQNTKKWELCETYGGKIVENIVQGVARDCLAEFLLRLDRRCYRTVFHVHDEAIIDNITDKAQLDEILKIMKQQIDWAEGLNLNGEGFMSEYYMKD